MLRKVRSKSGFKMALAVPDRTQLESVFKAQSIYSAIVVLYYTITSALSIDQVSCIGTLL